jgi:hypothetical protein
MRLAQNGSIWAPFWEAFSLKTVFVLHRFLHQISEGIFRGFKWIPDFNFMTIGLQIRCRNRKRENMKNLCFIKENLCFRRSRRLFLGLKDMKQRSHSARRIRRRFFNGFSWISASVWSSNIEKIDKEPCINRTRFRSPPRTPVSC